MVAGCVQVFLSQTINTQERCKAPPLPPRYRPQTLPDPLRSSGAEWVRLISRAPSLQCPTQQAAAATYPPQRATGHAPYAPAVRSFAPPACNNSRGNRAGRPAAKLESQPVRHPRRQAHALAENHTQGAGGPLLSKNCVTSAIQSTQQVERGWGSKGECCHAISFSMRPTTPVQAGYRAGGVNVP